MPNINTLKESDKKFLEDILSKELLDLTANEVGILNARRDYLTVEQKSFFGEALDGTFLGKDRPAPKVKKELK